MVRARRWSAGARGLLFAVACVLGCTEPTPEFLVTPIAVTLSRSEVAVGGGVQATAHLMNTIGPPATGQAVAWSVSDNTAASIDSTGLVLAFNPGIISVTATSNGQRGSAALTIVATGDFNVRFVGPSPAFGEPSVFVADTAAVVVRVSSVYELTSVVMSAGEHQSTLTPLATSPTCSGCRGGTLDLSGVPVGPIELTITATDARGTTQTVTRSFIHDNPPRITLLEPIDQSVGRGGVIRVRATCTDDSGPCATIGMLNQDPATARGKAQLDTNVARPDGREFLRVIATDRFGQSAFVDRIVYFDRSAHLSEVASAPMGRVIDAQGANLLFVVDSLDRFGTVSRQTLWLRFAGADHALASSAIVSTAFLAPHGAIFLTPTNATTSLSEWRDGAVLDLSEGADVTSLSVSGTFAAWSPLSFQPPIYRRDLATGTTNVVTQQAFGIPSGIAANGDVAWSLAGDVQWLHGSAVQAVTVDGMATFDSSPVTDGVSVVFRRSAAQNRCPCSIAALVADGAVTLSTSNGSYAAAGGWVAFTRPGTDTTTSHVWTRAPDGTTRQVDQLNGAATIEALLNDGTVILSSGTRRYLSTPPYAAAIDVAANQGTVIVRDGRAIELLGRSAFSISP